MFWQLLYYDGFCEAASAYFVLATRMREWNAVMLFAMRCAYFFTWKASILMVYELSIALNAFAWLYQAQPYWGSKHPFIWHEYALGGKEKVGNSRIFSNTA